jgi:hypothetical protein
VEVETCQSECTVAGNRSCTEDRRALVKAMGQATDAVVAVAVDTGDGERSPIG